MRTKHIWTYFAYNYIYIYIYIYNYIALVKIIKYLIKIKFFQTK